MYLVQVIEKVKDDFDIMTETFETEDEARKWFWYLAYTHNVESIMYTTDKYEEGKIFFSKFVLTNTVKYASIKA